MDKNFLMGYASGYFFQPVSGNTYSASMYSTVAAVVTELAIGDREIERHYREAEPDEDIDHARR